MKKGFSKEEKLAIGTRIRNIRIAQGQNMAQFGASLIPGEKVAQSIVSRWENGQSLPNNRRLAAISKMGEISMEELLSPPANTQMDQAELLWDPAVLSSDPTKTAGETSEMLIRVFQQTDFSNYDGEELLLIDALLTFISVYHQKPGIKALSTFIDTLNMGSVGNVQESDFYKKLYSNAAKALLEDLRETK